MGRTRLLPCLALLLAACTSEHVYRCSLAPDPAADRVLALARPESTAAALRVEPFDDPGLSPADVEFLVFASQHGLAEVVSSTVALDREVRGFERDFARAMIETHLPLTQDLVALAERKGFRPPRQLTPDRQRRIDELARLRGEPLRRAYHEMQVFEHDEALRVYGIAVEQVEDPELRELARATLPILRAHRDRLLPRAP